MKFRQLLLLFFLIITTGSLAAQEVELSIDEQPEKRTEVRLPPNTAEAVFVASTNDFVINPSNASLSQCQEPKYNRASRMYEYVVRLTLVGEDGTSYLSRKFSVEQKKTGLKAETEHKVIFQPGERRYFLISRSGSDIAFILRESEGNVFMREGMACVEITTTLSDLIVDVPAELPHTIEGSTTKAGAEVIRIIINTNQLKEIKAQNREDWEDITTIRIALENSTEEFIRVAGILPKELKRYSVIPIQIGGSSSDAPQEVHHSFFFTLNGSYSPIPAWSTGFKLGQIMNVAGWYFSMMTNFNFKGAFRPFENGRYYDLTGQSKTVRLSLLAGAVIRPIKYLSIHVGAGVGYFAQTFETIEGGWYALHDNTYLGVDVATGLGLHFGKFMLSAEAVTTNFKTIEIKCGLGFAL